MYRLLIFILLIGSLCSANAQNLSGKWVGYFTTNAGLSYPYEVTIQDDGNTHLTATTLTKFSNGGMALASANGIFTKQSKLASILETRFDQVKLAPNTQACLMSNFLTYTNINGQEILQGTYMSNNLSGNSDCGSGNVVLTKEMAFVVAPKAIKVIKTKPIKKEPTKLLIAAKQTIVKDTIKSNTTATTQPEKMVSQTNNSAAIHENINQATVGLDPIAKTVNTNKQKKLMLIPWVLISRDNKLIKTINTNKNKISIDLYDNGSFESDSISVYDNNILLFDRIKLSYKDFHFELPMNDTISKHELVFVAHITATNTRNSAILIYKDNALKEEYIINTNNKANAKIIFQYDPKTKSSE